MQLIPTSKSNKPTVIQCPLCNKDVSQLNEFTKTVWKEKEKHRKTQISLLEMYDEMVEEKMKSSQLKTKLQEVKCKKSRLNKIITDLFEAEVARKNKYLTK